MIDGSSEERLAAIQTSVERLYGKQYNRDKELALALPTRDVLFRIIDEQFWGKDSGGLLTLDSNSQYLRVYWTNDVVFTHFLLHNTKESWGTHVPDFAIDKGGITVLAVECKNVNPDHLVHLDWLKKQVVNRFESYRSATFKLAILSYFAPYQQDKSKVERLLTEERIDIGNLGVQPLRYQGNERDRTAAKIKKVLRPYLIEKLGWLP